MAGSSDKGQLLAQVFQKTNKLIGSSFKDIANDYKDIDLATFSEHLKKYKISRDFPFIPEMAQLEYLLYHCFQNKNDQAPELDIEGFLEALDEAPDAIKLIPNPTLKLLRCRYPIDKIYSLDLSGEEKLSAIKSDRPNYYFTITMLEDLPELQSIMPETFTTIELALLGTPLEGIYGEVFEDSDPKLFEKVLREMIDKNLLTDFEMMELDDDDYYEDDEDEEDIDDIRSK